MQPRTISNQSQPTKDEGQIKRLDRSYEPEQGKSSTHVDDKTDDGPAPDGGMEAWLVAGGGFCIFFCCLGFSNSFGILADYYIQNQLRGESAQKIAWIGSLSAFLQFLSGMVGGPLFDQFGSKVYNSSAAVLYVFSMMMLSLCETYWQFMLCQAVLMGLLMGLLQFPSMAAVSQFLDKNRAAAIDLAVSGSSIGGHFHPHGLVPKC
ncbi:hypothetical protein J3459_017944 [Metarhizium acridum]|nr:hypothetical protein J3459_017944 [Metarhizium acridum]